MSRFPHFLDNRLTDGGEVSSLTRRPRFIPKEEFCYPLCERLSGPQIHSAARRIRSTEKSNNLIENRTSDLPVIVLRRILIGWGGMGSCEYGNEPRVP
jgi:hypothetical protein